MQTRHSAAVPATPATAAIRATRPTRPTPPWPAQELDGTWDTGLQLWRYGRIMASIREREAALRPPCDQPCCAHLAPPPADGGSAPEVVIEVPVPPLWRSPEAGGKTIAAYGCTGTVLTGQLYDGATVLAAFPLAPLRRAIAELSRRARAAQRLFRAARSCTRPPHQVAAALAAASR